MIYFGIMLPDRHGGVHALHMHFTHAGHVLKSPQTLRKAIFKICCEYEDDRSIFRGPNQQSSLCLLVHRKFLIAARAASWVGFHLTKADLVARS